MTGFRTPGLTHPAFRASDQEVRATARQVDMAGRVRAGKQAWTSPTRTCSRPRPGVMPRRSAASTAVRSTGCSATRSRGAPTPRRRRGRGRGDVPGRARCRGAAVPGRRRRRRPLAVRHSPPGAAAHQRRSSFCAAPQRLVHRLGQLPSLDADEAEAVDAAIDASRLAPRLAAAMATTLRDKDRELLRLVGSDGLSPAQAGAVLGMNANTARIRAVPRPGTPAGPARQHPNVPAGPTLAPGGAACLTSTSAPRCPEIPEVQPGHGTGTDGGRRQGFYHRASTAMVTWMRSRAGRGHRGRGRRGGRWHRHRLRGHQQPPGRPRSHRAFRAHPRRRLLC